MIDVKNFCFDDPQHTSEKLITKSRGALGKMAHPTGVDKKSIDFLLREKISPYLEGDFELSFTFHRNFFPYGIHTDAGYDSDEYLYKQGIIPLQVFPTQADVYTIIFEQKAYHPISYPSRVETIESLKPKELALIEGLDNKNKISNEELSQYWQGHQDIDRFRGFEIALAFQWRPGDMAIWDRAHLHCSSDFLNHDIDGKVGLMWVTKKII